MADTIGNYGGAVRGPGLLIVALGELYRKLVWLSHGPRTHQSEPDGLAWEAL
ncbi:hypothetical protein [Aurantiacibacter xanthus]|uniref:hypothetical protein n=1 Tax=Aurantiacibacter xanthus TaxID=1784712 RepID=UPI00174D02BD|nr:hypothetical protein [Aurantiacibacter xanthus]